MPTRPIRCRLCGFETVVVAGRFPPVCDKAAGGCGRDAYWQVALDGREWTPIETPDIKAALKLELNDRRLLKRLYIQQWDNEPQGNPP